MKNILHNIYYSEIVSDLLRANLNMTNSPERSPPTTFGGNVTSVITYRPFISKHFNIHSLVDLCQNI